MRIRLSTTADRDQALRLAGRLTEGVAPWRDPARVAAAARGWVEDALATSDRADREMFVADVDGRIVGFVAVGVRVHFTGDRDAYVGELAVDGAFARRGVGRALMATAENWAVAHGLARITLETGAANGTARGFYAALGYQEEDVRLSRALR